MQRLARESAPVSAPESTSLVVQHSKDQDDQEVSDVVEGGGQSSESQQEPLNLMSELDQGEIDVTYPVVHVVDD